MRKGSGGGKGTRGDEKITRVTNGGERGRRDHGLLQRGKSYAGQCSKKSEGIGLREFKKGDTRQIEGATRGRPGRFSKAHWSERINQFKGKKQARAHGQPFLLTRNDLSRMDDGTGRSVWKPRPEETQPQGETCDRRLETGNLHIR